MFHTRENDWVFQGIPAKSWKYVDNPYAHERNYSKYPERVVTHPENEPYVKCSTCHTSFATDPRRLNERGQWVYAPVTNFISYRRATGQYNCVMPCST